MAILVDLCKLKSKYEHFFFSKLTFAVLMSAIHWKGGDRSALLFNQHCFTLCSIQYSMHLHHACMYRLTFIDCFVGNNINCFGIKSELPVYCLLYLLVHMLLSSEQKAMHSMHAVYIINLQ